MAFAIATTSARRGLEAKHVTTPDAIKGIKRNKKEATKCLSRTEIDRPAVALESRSPRIQTPTATGPYFEQIDARLAGQRHFWSK